MQHSVIYIPCKTIRHKKNNSPQNTSIYKIIYLIYKKPKTTGPLRHHDIFDELAWTFVDVLESL